MKRVIKKKGVRIFCAYFLEHHATIRIRSSFTKDPLLEGMSDYLTSLTYPFSPFFFLHWLEGLVMVRNTANINYSSFPQEMETKAHPVKHFELSLKSCRCSRRLEVEFLNLSESGLPSLT